MIFDDLQTACSDLEAYIKVPPRPPYGRYVRWLESYAYEAGFTYWLARHTVFDNLVHKFPVLGSVEVIPTCTVQTKKLLHLPKGEDTEFSLPIMGRTYFPESLLPISYKNLSLYTCPGSKGSVYIRTLFP